MEDKLDSSSPFKKNTINQNEKDLTLKIENRLNEKAIIEQEKEFGENLKLDAQDIKNKVHGDIASTSLSVIETVFNSWATKETEDQYQRKKFIQYTYGFLLLQFIIAVFLIVFDGFETIDVSENVFISFFGAIILQFIGIVFVIAKYLFKERSVEPLELVLSLTQIIGNYNNGIPLPQKVGNKLFDTPSYKKINTNERLTAKIEEQV